MENLPEDFFVTSLQLTKTTYGDAYPPIDPIKPANSQAGKVIVTTGASKGIGRQVRSHGFPIFPCTVTPPESRLRTSCPT